jgi:hypothetical protein
MRIAAVIVSYNSGDDLPGCLHALQPFASEFAGGVLVVDNASTDNSVEVARRYEFARLYQSPANLGFAGAVNLGFDLLHQAEAVLILNPDTRILCSPVLLAQELTVPQVAAACGQLLDDSGALQIGFQVRRFPGPLALAFEVLGLNRLAPGNGVNRHWRALDLDPQEPAWVEQPAGACLMVHKQAWLELGGFDEGFHPVWFEDVDFLRRAAGAGWRIRYNPHFRARHRGGHSVSKISWTSRQLYWYGSVLRYANRHFRPRDRRIVSLAVLVGLVPRLVMGMITERSSLAVRVCGRLMRLAFSYLMTGIPEEGPRRTDRRAETEDCGPFGS